MLNRNDVQIDAAEELLHEALQQKNPENIGNDVCTIADEILGPREKEAERSLKTGLMNKEGAVEMLEQLAKILQNVLDEHTEELSPESLRKFQEYVRTLIQRIETARGAKNKVDDLTTAIRMSAGAFKAYAS